MRVSTRLKKPVRPIHKGRRPSAASTKGGRLSAAPLWNPLWMGLTGFFKRVETRMFQRVQTSWPHRAFHELLGNLGSRLSKKNQLTFREMTPIQNKIPNKQNIFIVDDFPSFVDDFLHDRCFCPASPIGALPDWLFCPTAPD